MPYMIAVLLCLMPPGGPQQELTGGTTSHMPSVLSSEQQDFLAGYDWIVRVGDRITIWVSVDEQLIRIIREERIILEVPCATAAKGTGNLMDSYMTPLGWHSVKRKVGDGAPWGQVFRSKFPTSEIWKLGVITDEDLVLTRILVLEGEEAGVNKGGNVDSYDRSIYIHGTNAEDKIGTPTSHGCIRLTNDDAIKVFDMVPEGAMLLITEGLES